MDNYIVEPKISVIVPIYNVEEYLERCLDSIVAQDFSDYEVILINDGSTDHSAQMASLYAKKHPIFKYVSQPNGGLSSARNKGITLARGKYLCFIDSDDAIEPNYLKKLYDVAETYSADIVISRFTRHWIKSDITIKQWFKKRPGVYDSKVLLHSLIRDLTVHFYVWNKLYRHTLFTEHNISFPKMRFEDMATVPKLFFYSNKIAVIPDYLYNYTKRKNSIVSEMSLVNLNDYVKAFCKLRLFLDQNNSFYQYKKAFNLLKWKASIAVFPWTLLLHIKKQDFRGIITNFKSLYNRLKRYTDKNRISSYEDLEFPVVNLIEDVIGEVHEN